MHIIHRQLFELPIQIKNPTKKITKDIGKKIKESTVNPRNVIVDCIA